jgi:hypothetical protein
MSELKHKKISEENLSSLPIIGDQPKNEKEEKFLREIGEFEFYNLEEPGVCHPFTYGDTRKNHRFTMYHGEKYRVPRFIARHLESRSTPRYEWRPDEKGGLQKISVGTKPRFRMSQVFS